MKGEGEFALGGRRVGGGDTWTAVMVPCGPWEATCRRAYAAAGWPDLWAYDFMPKWLRPAWHHETDAYHVPRQCEEVKTRRAKCTSPPSGPVFSAATVAKKEHDTP